MVKVRINREDCVSCGPARMRAPYSSKLGSDDTLSRLAKAYRVDGKPEQGDAPPDLEECINEAAVLCPLQVMFVG